MLSKITQSIEHLSIWQHMNEFDLIDRQCLVMFGNERKDKIDKIIRKIIMEKCQLLYSIKLWDEQWAIIQQNMKPFKVDRAEIKKMNTQMAQVLHKRIKEEHTLLSSEIQCSITLRQDDIIPNLEYIINSIRYQEIPKQESQVNEEQMQECNQDNLKEQECLNDLNNTSSTQISLPGQAQLDEHNNNICSTAVSAQFDQSEDDINNNNNVADQLDQNYDDINNDNIEHAQPVDIWNTQNTCTLSTQACSNQGNINNYINANEINQYDEECKNVELNFIDPAGQEICLNIQNQEQEYEQVKQMEIKNQQEIKKQQIMIGNQIYNDKIINNEQQIGLNNYEYNDIEQNNQDMLIDYLDNEPDDQGEYQESMD